MSERNSRSAFAALTAIALTATVVGCREPDAATLLAEAVSLSPGIEGRLAGVPHRPAPTTLAPGQRARLRQLRLALLGQAGPRGRDADPVQRGLVALVSGDALQAVRELEAAYLVDRREEVANDLAVALASAARSGSSMLARIRALSILEEVVDRPAASATVKLNRALLLARLHLVEQARASLDEVIATLPGNDPWRAIAERERRALVDRLAAVRGAEERARNYHEYLAERAAASEFARDEPFLARELVLETILGQWAAAHRANDPRGAARELEIAGWLARSLADSHGERLVLEAVSSIRDADDDGRDELAAAHLSYRAGRERFENDDTDGASERLAAARRGFEAHGSPLAYWCRYFMAAALYYHDVEAARRDLEVLALEVPETYPSLAGRVEWMRGSIAHVVQDAGAGLQHYLVAHDLRLRGSGARGAAYPKVLVALAYQDLGDSEAAFGYMGEALEGLMYTSDPRHRDVVLLVCSDNLVALGEPRYGAPFAREAVLAAAEAGGLRLASAYETRARVERALGRSREALADVRRSLEHLQTVSPGGIRDYAERRSRVGLALVLAEVDPRLGASELGAVLDHQLATGYEYQRAEILLGRARALRASGRLDEARRDLDAALVEFEQVRSSVADLELRARSAATGRAALEELVAMELESAEPDFRHIAGLAERARSRVLVDLAGSGRVVGPETAVEEVLAGEETVALYTVLTDRLLVLKLADGRVTGHTVPVTAEALEAAVLEFRSWLTGQLGRQAPSAARDLHRWLLEPLGLDGHSGRLVVIPDALLQGLPFGLLRGPDDAPALDTLRVVAAPSLALLGARPGSGAPTSGGVLSVGVGRSESYRSSGLPDLPGAVDEARAVGAAYPEATVLIDDEADFARLVRELPAHRVVHVAGHAVAEPGAALGAALVLPGGPEAARLRLRDLARLQLERVELLVLSACDTAVGFEAGPEGVGGLAAGFLSRGVGTVIAAVAQTNDLESVSFMRDLHGRVAAGEPPAEALHAVSLERLASWDRWQEPPGTWSLFIAYTGGMTR